MSSRPPASLPAAPCACSEPCVCTPCPPSSCCSVLVNRGALPGSNGSDTRANAVAAGLIVVLIGNYIQIILAALHDTKEPGPAIHGSDKDLA